MRIAIASGKGGTGKTTVATNLARVASRNGRAAAYLDCDVEEPNGHIFLKPEITHQEVVDDPVPQVDQDRCTMCGQCAEICQYNAIACVGSKVLVYADLCHGCGGCALVCPAGAIQEVPRRVGVLETGSAGEVRFVHGLLDIGQVRAIPVIQAVKDAAGDEDVTLIDAPPGTSCPVIEAVRGADFVVLVTEPTPFGLHDLKLAVEMTRALDLPLGVVVNRAGPSGAEVRRYCDSQEVFILQEIPDDRRLAEAYSRGVLASDAFTEFDSIFRNLLDTVSRQCTSNTASRNS